MRMRVLGILVLVVGAASLPVGVGAGTVGQLISRENPSFNNLTASFTIGRDGAVYLTNSTSPGFLMRMERDGGAKSSGEVVYATSNATANANGLIAVASAHFAHKVTIYNSTLEVQAQAADFLVSDQVGWDAPAHVEAGASGDFWAVDQHRDRIVRIGTNGIVKKAYAIPHEPAGNDGLVEDFRVDEARQRFWLLTRSRVVHCAGFDGQKKWDLAINGPFDVDEAGTLYTIDRQGEAVKKFSRAGQPAGQIVINAGDRRGTGQNPYVGLRVWGQDILLRRWHPTELFVRYDLASGDGQHAVESDHEHLAITYPQDVWMPGELMPFEIRHEAGEQVSHPKWHVWARRLNWPEYRELAMSEGRLLVPADMEGLYQIKVSPEVRPLQYAAPSEYLVQTWVEIRPKGAKGCAAIITPGGRTQYARGEAVGFSLLVRKEEAGAAAVGVRLMQGSTAIAEMQANAQPGQAVGMTLPGSLTAALAPGEYVLAVAAPGLTCMGQHLRIGRSIAQEPFHTVAYGDYRTTYPAATIWSGPDIVAAHVQKIAKLGFNLLVDRVGDPTQAGAFAWSPGDREAAEALNKRLAGDGTGAPPEIGRLNTPFLQALAGYGGAGIRQMAILMRNDAGLPLGSGFDSRKPEELTATITRLTEQMAPMAAFRGWSWSSNWWVFNQRGSAAATSAEEKTAYEVAMKRAKETGAWDEILDKVAARRLALAPEAQDLFNRTLRAVAPGLVTASAAPFRNVEAYPPVSLANVDEVDLQAQWEQIAVPYHAAFGVDFYKRAGKPAWGHPEVWNDSGTGEQVIPTLFQLVMRGADGTGCSGLPPWWPCPQDPRTGSIGTLSVFRSTNALLRQYGPWLTTLKNADRVAIVASRRMFIADEWGGGVMGTHFARVFEAYISCLRVHRPASIVFSDDLKKETLSAYKAVLVVDQRVEMEGALADALSAAKAAGVSIFYDGTCRASLVGNFQPLGISFDKVEKDPSQAGDDSAYVRFREYARANREALEKALGAVAPVAGVADDEILLSQRVAEQGSYIFVVNNTMLDVDPAYLWRVTLFVTSRLPVRAPVKLEGNAPAVYDLFALAQLRPTNGTVLADLRTLPVRILAVLPAAIQKVVLNSPGTVKAGQPFAWSVHVVDAGGKAIAASIPVRLRLVGADGAVVEERFIAAGSKGATGTMQAALNAAGPLKLEAAELCSGKTAAANIAVTPMTRAIRLTAEGGWNPPATAPIAAAQPAAAKPAGKTSAKPAPAPKPPVVAAPTSADKAFGPHIRDITITHSAPLAVVNTMNWDDNLYGVDVASGQVRWRQRIGDYFTFRPHALVDGFATEGFDFHAPEGYFLYLANAEGQVSRRFALYGLPTRLPHRFVPGLVHDAIDNFAIPRDRSWVASAGDLGLAMWSRDGKLLWSQDWWKTRRHTAKLAVLDPATLLVIDGMTVTAYRASVGEQLWQVTLASAGEAKVVRVCERPATVAVLASTDGGTLFVVRDGKALRSFPTVGQEMGISPDGSAIAVAAENQLKLYTVAEGLKWILPCDDVVQFPRFSADGKRIAAGSELGSLYVVDVEGKVLLERDMGAAAVPAWLGDGDLLVGTWMGTLMRLGADYRPKWQTLLNPEVKDMRGKLLGDDNVPTSRIAQWGNAEAGEAPPARPNLLVDGKAKVSFIPSGDWGGRAQLVHDPELLMDGKTDPPAAPWLDWSKVGFFAETSPFNYILMDSQSGQMRVTGITLYEDAAHPESWLRDAKLEYWDERKQQWIEAMPLLSNAPVHTHKLAKAVTSARWRIVLPWGVVGNLRLSEIVLHGAMVNRAR